MATPKILLRNNPAYKASKLLGYNPYGTRFIPIEMDFSRSSSGSVEKSTGIVNMGTGVPRVDVNGSVLLEPARTNLLTYSQQFDNAAWTKTGATISANAASAPDGTTTADEITSTGTGLIAQFSKWSITESVGGVFAKAGTSNRFRIENSSLGGGVNFDLSNGTIESESAGFTGIIANYGNGWYRISAVHTAGASQTFGIKILGGSGETGFIWGAQLEVGAYPTSYIKTEGSTVTRAAETLSKTGLASLLGDSEGVFYTEFSVPDISSFYLISLSNGTSTDRVTLGINSSGQVVGNVRVGDVSQFSTTTAASVNTIYKVAISYKASEFKLFVNGTKISEQLSGSTFSGGTLTNLSFDRGDNVLPFFGNVKALAVYDTALSDTELAILTTL